jgi:hypothetical protein
MKRIIVLTVMMTLQINSVARLTNDGVDDRISENDLAHRTAVSIEMSMNQTSNEQRVDIRHSGSVRDEKESTDIAIIV